jgi:CRP-like cAMP-binding protein
MSLDQEMKLLRRIALFSKIEASKLKLLAFTSEWVSFQPGQFICRQGEPGDSAYIIIEGEADVTLDTTEGQVKIASRGANDIIGETAIMCDVPRTASVQARTPLTALKVSKEVFLQLLTSYPQMAIEVIRALANRLTSTGQQLTEALARSKGEL